MATLPFGLGAPIRRTLSFAIAGTETFGAGTETFGGGGFATACAGGGLRLRLAHANIVNMICYAPTSEKLVFEPMHYTCKYCIIISTYITASITASTTIRSLMQLIRVCHHACGLLVWGGPPPIQNKTFFSVWSQRKKHIHPLELKTLGGWWRPHCRKLYL